MRKFFKQAAAGKPYSCCLFKIDGTRMIKSFMASLGRWQKDDIVSTSHALPPLAKLQISGIRTIRVVKILKPYILPVFGDR